MQGAPEGKFDLITCRNSVFLYLPKAQHEFALRRLVEDCLNDRGFLIVGANDHLPSSYASLGLVSRCHECLGLYQLRHKKNTL